MDPCPYGPTNSYGHPMAIACYRDGKANGRMTYFYSNGQKREDAIVKDDRLWGILGEWDSLGRSFDYGTLRDGNGIVRYCKADGTLREYGQYTNGLRNGEWRQIVGPGDTALSSYADGWLTMNGKRYFFAQ